MRYWKLSSMIITAVLLLLFYFPGNASAQDASAGPYAGDSLRDALEKSGALVFQADFTDSPIGAHPVGWHTIAARDEYGVIEVVEDSSISSGRAVRIATHRYSGLAAGISIESPPWDIPFDDADTIVIDYKTKWVDGEAGIYTYINKSSHRLILLPWSGHLLWHTSADGQRPLRKLKDGWNDVRIVANKATGTATVFLNDMRRPVGRGLPFQRPVNAWDGTVLRFRHVTSEAAPREVYYADVNIWASPEPLVEEPLPPVAGLLPYAAGEEGKDPKTPLILAHRGKSFGMPENTLVAFERAVDIGVDFIETDVRRTRDGHVVIMHDATVDRTTRGAYTGNVTELTLEEIKTLDAGISTSIRMMGERVPTLEEALTAFRGRAMFWIEGKQSGIEEDIADVIVKTGMQNNVVYQSFSAASVKRFRELMPEVAAALLFTYPGDEGTDLEHAASMTQRALAVDAQIVAPNYRVVTADFVRYVQSRGLSVWPWSVNNKKDIQRLIDFGVDGIVTDFPERVHEVLHGIGTAK